MVCPPRWGNRLNQECPEIDSTKGGAYYNIAAGSNAGKFQRQVFGIVAGNGGVEGVTNFSGNGVATLPLIVFGVP